MKQVLRTDHEQEDMSHSNQPEIKVIFKVIPLTDDNDPDGSRRQRQLEAIVALLARATKRQRAETRASRSSAKRGR